MKDGTFRLFYRRGWAWLAVSPPAPGGRPVYPEEVENRMRLLQVPRVSTREIQRRIEDADDTPSRLVEWPDGERLASSISVTVADDRMSASMVVEAPRKGAAPPELEDLLEALEEEGVTFGVDRQELTALLRGRKYDRERTVARGRDPVFGSASRVQYHFNTDRGRPWMEMDFGRINLRELNFIAHCREGDLLAELLPPVQPVDGMTVKGERIPAARDAVTVRLKGGENTRLESDGTRLFATADGNARIREGAVIVEPLVVVPAVNYETGNIRFEGSVVVEGGVADGFVLEAGGDIEVRKGVGRAVLRAGGSVLLKTGMTGAEEGSIECGGDLLARYLESCTVTSRSNVLVEEAIMHSRVTVWNHCVLSGRRAEFIGGELIAGGSLWCRKLGNFSEVRTRVSLGVDPNRMLAYRSARGNLETSRTELDRTEQQLDQCEQAIRDGHGGEKVRLARDQLRTQAERINAEIGSLNGTVRTLRDQLEASRRSILVVEDEMFHGVTVAFGMREYRAPERGARKTVLRVRESGLEESGLDPQNRPVLDFGS
ncbi:MAG: DUF342 domain-containing protein [Spirochaetaceae bacterium]|nr:MAG: DUF342 domain-containing protein [Spirochaetaceae bacterium]